jgi:formylglycine-generating enzyme required for sulfatase activity
MDLLGPTQAPALDPIAWHGGNSGQDYDLRDGSTQGTRIVATRQSNPWGLFDMLGNVDEWCRDSQRRYTTDAVDDPVDESGGDRVLRGGSWCGDARHLRAADRHAEVPGIFFGYLGFRLLRARVRL